MLPRQSSVADRLVDRHGVHVKAAGAGLWRGGVRGVGFLMLAFVRGDRRLIPDQLDVGRGCSWRPVPCRRGSEMLKLSLFLAPAEWTAS
jgi:hypothetical protein